MKHEGLMIAIGFILKILLRIGAIIYIPLAIAASILLCIWAFTGWIIVGGKSFNQCEDGLEILWPDAFTWIIEKIKSLPKRNN